MGDFRTLASISWRSNAFPASLISPPSGSSGKEAAKAGTAATARRPDQRCTHAARAAARLPCGAAQGSGGSRRLRHLNARLPTPRDMFAAHSEARSLPAKARRKRSACEFPTLGVLCLSAVARAVRHSKAFRVGRGSIHDHVETWAVV